MGSTARFRWRDVCRAHEGASSGLFSLARAVRQQSAPRASYSQPVNGRADHDSALSEAWAAVDQAEVLRDLFARAELGILLIVCPRRGSNM